jgi:hypothetical protein
MTTNVTTHDDQCDNQVTTSCDNRRHLEWLHVTTWWQLMWLHVTTGVTWSDYMWQHGDDWWDYIWQPASLGVTTCNDMVTTHVTTKWLLKVTTKNEQNRKLSVLLTQQLCYGSEKWNCLCLVLSGWFVWMFCSAGGGLTSSPYKMLIRTVIVLLLLLRFGWCNIRFQFYYYKYT